MILMIIEHWVQILSIKLGWINDFNKLVVKYATTSVMLNIFSSSSKLIKTFDGHIGRVHSIDYSEFDGGQFICSGSQDYTVRVWDVDTTKQIGQFRHSSVVNCVKFSPYHYHNLRLNVICFSSFDKAVRFWDIKENKQLQIFNENDSWFSGIVFSSFNSGQYLCSGSFNKTIRLLDVETTKTLHTFNGHTASVWCVSFSPLQNSNDKSNNIGVIGGNGYTICSGSSDQTIRMWDIETGKQLTILKGHEGAVLTAQYGSNESGIVGGVNIILSGSADKSVRLWDVRSSKHIQVFNGHTDDVSAVEYSPFVVNNIEAGGSSNVICSGSLDNTIRFWDIRSNKDELHVIKGDDGKDRGIVCFKFLLLNTQGRHNEKTNGGVDLCYGSYKGPICIWG
ncbi:WD-40 repeat protein [Reticulomyxa filosa]|uniref:WD-40 repeat protein n=1 Tax=Reticulomyxa filosa TaxID=46433 RepID=X6P6N6_RETFI|nr:WD-40 repeat protein [Reticulomyxa filosa]|eukprot:ETO33282.1 WD-40 repeat protein [Reticulomyxa filosa]